MGLLLAMAISINEDKKMAKACKRDLRIAPYFHAVHVSFDNFIDWNPFLLIDFNRIIQIINQ